MNKKKLRIAIVLFSAIFLYIITNCWNGDEKGGKQILINPRITSDRVIDMHDINSIIAGIIKSGMTDEQKVLAVFYLLNRNGYEGVYPTDGNPVSWRTCDKDPVKFLNIYPWGECGTYQNLTCELLSSIGIPSRRIEIKDHWIPESWYNNGWHYIDPRWGMIFYKRDGQSIASVKDLYEDTTLMTRPVRQDVLVYPCDSRGVKLWAEMYSFWKVLPNSSNDTTT